MADGKRIARDLLIAAVVIGLGFGLWKFWQAKSAAQATSSAAWAQVTPSAEALVAGQTPLAPDLGSGGPADILPTNVAGISYDPYTGTDTIEPEISVNSEVIE